MLITLAWRNLWRHPSRTWLSIASMALTAALLVFMLSFQLGMYDTLRSGALKLLDGFAQVQPPGYIDDPDVRKVIHSPQQLVSSLNHIDGMIAAPRASSYVILAHDQLSYGALLEGVDASREPRITTLAATIHSGRYLNAQDSQNIIMGRTLARNLKLSVGDKVTLLGSAADGSIAADSLTLTGIFDTGVIEVDRQLAQMPLARFQETFAMNRDVNIIAIGGGSLHAVDQQLPRIDKIAENSKLVLHNWTVLRPDVHQAITLDFSTALLWYAAMVLIVTFILLNTLLMSVFERQREFGILLAIGMQARQTGIMIWLELLLLAALGNIIGILLGGSATLWLQYQGISLGKFSGLFAQWGLPDRIHPQLSMTSAVSGPLVMIILIGIAGLIPYYHLRRVTPLTAMQSI
ncbi:MAG: FtsX-like permease family protein [Steroidobacter sp.]